MNKRLIFEAACLRRQCGDCPLGVYGCSLAPVDMLLEEARKHYANMKNGTGFAGYDRVLTKEHGEGYAKEFMTTKAKVI